MKQERKLIIYIVVFMVLCLIGCFVFVIVNFNNGQYKKEHMVFSDISELENIVDIKKVSEEDDKIIENLRVKKIYTFTYDNLDIDIKSYIFEENSAAMAYYNILMRGDWVDNEGYAISSVLSHSKYCIYKNNNLLFIETNSGNGNINKFIEILDENLTISVSNIDT